MKLFQQHRAHSGSRPLRSVIIKTLSLLTLTSTVIAQEEPHGALFAMTNEADGNNIVAFDRVGADGELVLTGIYPTGGVGDNINNGSGANPLASQDPLIITPKRDMVITVNAGSNTISVFAAAGSALDLVQTLPSYGVAPVSLTYNDGLLYVANEGDGTVAGFRQNRFGRFFPIGIVRDVGFDAGAVEFAPDGRSLIVTERTTDTIFSIPLSRTGRPRSRRISSIESAAPQPFGTDIRSDGILLVSEGNFGVPGESSLSSYSVGRFGKLSLISSAVVTGFTFGCWVEYTDDGRYAYVSNTPDGVMTSYAVDPHGQLTLLEPNAGQTGVGVLDAEMAGNQLYVVTSTESRISQFTVNSDGSLTRNEAIEFANPEILPAPFPGIAGY